MIRPISKQDYKEYITMATDFYNSEAVLHSIPQNHIETTFTEITTSNQYVEGYIFEYDEKIAGYALIAKTFSQEAGGIVIWIEELYVKEDYRNNGLGKAFFEFIDEKAKTTAIRLRLEVEEDNEKAIALYEKMGFRRLNYLQMYKGK